MKTHYIIISLLLLIGTLDTYSQSTNQNYILTRTFTDESGTVANSLDVIQYYDGLGRPTQNVQKKASPNSSDIITLQEYDAFGRDSIAWLPAIISGNNGVYASLTTIKSAAISTNGSNQKPYALPVYEPSPLNRVLKQFGPGTEWQNNNKAVETDYQTNTVSAVNGNTHLVCGKYVSTDTKGSISISRSVNYSTGELYVTRIKDEDGNISYEFKDKLGQVILTRQINGAEILDTYYVYDSYGNLRVVLPPKASDLLISGTWTESDTNLKSLTYLYKYDNHNRCISKKLPGCNWTHFVYDKADRLIFTQDGEQRVKDEWLFNKYDVFGRIVLTGIQVVTGKTHTDMLNLTKDVVVKEEFNVGLKMGYTWNSLTSVINKDQCKILSVNYYDNYKFRALSGFSNSNMVCETSGIDAAFLKRHGLDGSLFEHKGLLTGTATALLDGSNTMLYSCLYYDSKQRLIQTKSSNHKGGYEKEYVAYNFIGQPVKKMHIHTKDANNGGKQTETYTYTYDHAGRLLTTKHKLNSLPEITLSQNTYDQLGRIVNKRFGVK